MVNSKTKLIHPQEVEVWYIIPAIRRAIALELKNFKIEQKEIASLLGVTEAAISQYLQNKRGEEFSMPLSLKSKIHDSALKLLKKESTALIEVNKLSSTDEIFLLKCRIHRQNNPSLKNCHICKECRQLMK